MHCQPVHQHHNLYHSVSNFVMPEDSHRDSSQAMSYHLPDRVRDDHEVRATKYLPSLGFTGGYSDMKELGKFDTL
ncbi:hypothetical protein RJ035_004945 [Blastomyces gilchristii]